MKITITDAQTTESYRVDTDKAKYHWNLSYWDGNNSHHGDVYVSKKGLWYVYTPSQWANQHSWIITTAQDILAEYDRYLTQDEKTAIAEVAGITFD